MITRGFTMIETVVVVALTSLIMGALGSLLVYFYQTNRYVFQQVSATLEARRGIEDTLRLVREAAYDEDGEYPILIAESERLRFSADTDNDDELEAVTYELLDGVLTRSVTPSSSGDLTTTSVSSSLINDVGSPVFRYFDTAGTELTDPIDRADIASVEVSLTIEADTNQGPTAFTLSGRGTLRNSRL